MTSEKGCRKDKNQNIQVFVRLRPLNQREKDIKSLGVIEVVNGKEVIVRQFNQNLHTKKFTFDRAFPPFSKQVEVYQEVVSPLIEEVLAGYNCTVFAYGQTGTGKTHTMVGEAAQDETTWQTDPLAGIIPRALSQLFDELRISNTEYTVRVSYLELYNEELFDLLSSSDDNSKLRIYEDVTRKGSNIVNGLEEITVYNKNEVYKIMSQGQERKRVASTLMNAQSSRSHTVFTIVVHMKENSPEGEELVKIGKLNLVDLAGSENISKAGSDNPAKRERARECVNINQSLLTLGRVITALVERHPHIPYRESKLTRILQESLGGRTKTSIIATISPGHKDLEETMSTLEYANRAKNIQNKPEINQKMTKKAILKEYAEEIDKLKRDLQAARDKNGVYLANETFAEMTFKQEEQRKEIQELLLKKRAMEEERDRMEAVFQELSDQLQNTEGQLTSTLHRLTTTENKLLDTASMLRSTRVRCSEQELLASAHAHTERALAEQARQLLAAADAASRDALRLHDAVDGRRSVESRNLEITRTYCAVSAQHRENIQGGADRAVVAVCGVLAALHDSLEEYTKETTEMCSENKAKLDELIQESVDYINVMTQSKEESVAGMSAALAERAAQARRAREAGAGGWRRALAALAEGARAGLRRAGGERRGAALRALLAHWNSSTVQKVEYLQNTHAAYETRLRTAAETRVEAARQMTTGRKTRADSRAASLRNRLEMFINDKEQTEQLLSDQLTELEKEKERAESRLLLWIEEERRLLEKRIENHVRSEREILDERLKNSMESIELQRKLFEERTAQHVQWITDMLVENDKEVEIAGEDLKENEMEIQQCVCDLGSYTEECKKGCGSILDSLGSLNEGALKVVDQIEEDLLNTLQQTSDYVQAETTKLIENNEQSLEQQQSDSNAVFDLVAQNYQCAVDKIVADISSYTSSRSERLARLSSRTSALESLSRSHAGGQARAAGAAQRELELLHRGLRDELARLAELEARCLRQEYAVYAPSGATPGRSQYRYPRALAATSPRERLLARARRQECEVVEVEGEGRASDSDSCASDDSVLPVPAAAPPAAHIVKCTSETDIYLRRRQQEQSKENVNRSMSFKKPSKLPAPASHKKVLAERNTE